MSTPKIAPSILAADFLRLQEFIPHTLRKIKQARELLQARNPQCEVEAAGGIELYTICAAYEAVARVFVSGTAVFDHADDPEAGVKSLIWAAQG